MLVGEGGPLLVIIVQPTGKGKGKDSDTGTDKSDAVTRGRGDAAKFGGYFGCRTVNFSAVAALFSFSSNDENDTAGAFPDDLSNPAADR